MNADYRLPSTLGVVSHAAMGARLDRVEVLRDALVETSRAGQTVLPVGEGSNIVPLPHVDAYAFELKISGVEVLGETDDAVTIRAGCGENWHAFVMRCLHEGWFGLENLALIPGSVGAAPVQNIGAYGVELSQHVLRVEGLALNGDAFSLSAADCGFGYRTSLFKSDPGIITHVTFQLSKRPKPELSYPDLAQRFQSQRDPHPSEVAQAVIDIRQSKLPDPAVVPNVGSFFKNPIVSEAFLSDLEPREPGLVRFSTPQGVKLSAAQLIDRAGWKERPGKGVMCWPQQPLVLVNTGTDDGADIMMYARAIRSDVATRYGVSLSVEPSVLGGSDFDDMTP